MKAKTLASYDESLRKYRYREALDKGLATKNPLVVGALLEALGERGALEKALSGRDADGLEPVLAYLTKWVLFQGGLLFSWAMCVTVWHACCVCFGFVRLLHVSMYVYMCVRVVVFGGAPGQLGVGMRVASVRVTARCWGCIPVGK